MSPLHLEMKRAVLLILAELPDLVCIASPSLQEPGVDLSVPLEMLQMGDSLGDWTDFAGGVLAPRPPI